MKPSLRRRVWSSILFFFAVLCPAFQLEVQMQGTKSLVIAVEDDAAPWSRSDGSGYANDVVVAAFKAVGINVELRVVPYARCKRMAVAGEVVGCFSTSPSPEFEGLIRLSSKPLFVVQSGYFYNTAKPPKAKRQEKLPAKTVVGTVIGYEYPPAFNRLKQQGIVIVEEAASEDINLRKLAAGRIDLALINYNEMKSPDLLLRRTGVATNVKPAFLAGTMNSYIGFSTKHPEGMSSLQQYNRGFSMISANGTLRQIRTKWLRLMVQ